MGCLGIMRVCHFLLRLRVRDDLRRSAGRRVHLDRHVGNAQVAKADAVYLRGRINERITERNDRGFEEAAYYHTARRSCFRDSSRAAYVAASSPLCGASSHLKLCYSTTCEFHGQTSAVGKSGGMPGEMISRLSFIFKTIIVADESSLALHGPAS